MKVTITVLVNSLEACLILVVQQGKTETTGGSYLTLNLLLRPRKAEHLCHDTCKKHLCVSSSVEK
jgi:hypothetical protein